MSAGPGQNVIASGVIQVNADVVEFTKAIGKIPEQMRAQARAAMSALQKELAATSRKIEANQAIKPTDAVHAQKLAQEFTKLVAVSQSLQGEIKKLSNEVQAEAAVTINATTAAKAKSVVDKQAIKDANDKAKALTALSRSQKASYAAEADQIKELIRSEKEHRQSLAGVQTGGSLVPGMNVGGTGSLLGLSMADRMNLGLMGSNQKGKGNQGGVGGGGSGRNNGGTANLGMASLMFSQAVEDVQYGFSAIVNNIPYLLMALGGGPGLAGVVSLAAVGVNQLINHWGPFTELLGITSTKIKSLSERIEDLSKNTSRSLADTAQLKRLEALKSGIDAQEQTPDRISGPRSRINSTIADANYEGLIDKAIKGIYGDFVKGIDPALTKAQKDAQTAYDEKKGRPMTAMDVLKGNKTTGERAAELQAAKDAVDVARQERAKEVRGNLQSPGRIKQFIERIKAEPDKFGGVEAATKLADDLKRAAMTPKEIEEDEGREQMRQYNERKGQQKIDQSVLRNTGQLGSVETTVGNTLLNSIKAGAELSYDQVKDAVKKSMRLSGETEGAISKGADKIAETLIENMRDAVKSRAAKEGISLLEAAKRMSQDAAVAMAMRPNDEIRRNFAFQGRDRDAKMDMEDSVLMEKRKKLESLTRGPQIAMENQQLDAQNAAAEAALLRQRQIDTFRSIRGHAFGTAPAAKSPVASAKKAQTANAKATARKQIAKAKMAANIRTRKLMGTKKGKGQLGEERLMSNIEKGIVPLVPNAALNDGANPSDKKNENDAKALETAQEIATNTNAVSTKMSTLLTAIQNMKSVAVIGP